MSIMYWKRFRKEIAEGGEILKTKMLKYLPKIALFNGKGIYEVFSGSKKFYFGLQPDPFPGCPDTVCINLLHVHHHSKEESEACSKNGV